jgi:ribosomal protein S18 acetylase RimI-like enzyme
MAALTDSALLRVVDLHQLRSQHLDRLLQEETLAWRERLSWDFEPSAALVRRFIDAQSLNGYALLVNEYPIGYCYFVAEERKGLIGDLYVLEDFFTPEYEERLLASVVDHMFRGGTVDRIESQLMMIRSGPSLALPARGFARSHGRNFMEVPLNATSPLQVAPGLNYLFDRWTDRHQDEAAGLIAGAYKGHIDSEINDQYRSPAGARRFLMNIIQFPGCGNFFQPASLASVDPRTGKLCGICLASLVDAKVGHITQVCISPEARGKALGYELIRRSLETLARHGATKATLTVTTTNRTAIALYERMGFRKVREFTAHVWDGFNGRLSGTPSIGYR